MVNEGGAQVPGSTTVAKVRPFLRWAGGKRQLRRVLLEFLPADVNNRTYREPFLGGGSLFFALQPEAAVLSDANEHLIRCYEFVRDEPARVARYLQFHAVRDGESYYYRVRDEYNVSHFSAAQAARFIYLNKTCFNGIFRVNTKGQFNVPYGWKESPAIPDKKDLTTVAITLKNASLQASSFEKALGDSSRGDFIYSDPPYPPLNGTAYFTHYTSDRFSEQDQRKLASCIHGLDRRGCLFMISNADTPLIRRLKRKPTQQLPKIDGGMIRVRRLIFRNMWIEDGDAQIARVLWNYFSAVAERWPKAWHFKQAGLVLNRTTGFRALMRFLPVAYLSLGGLDTIVSKEDFRSVFDKVKLSDDDFNPENFIPGTSGQAKLYRTLETHTRLDEHTTFNPKMPAAPKSA